MLADLVKVAYHLKAILFSWCLGLDSFTRGHPLHKISKDCLIYIQYPIGNIMKAFFVSKKKCTSCAGLNL
jgi:hypothetical protein